eukprot:TRINITY_DN7354_c0_g1_i6.p1 TRINITY_DN7354_c0_g1~~TRINITY_DN7354_c0_g1_i6.p1  ORF type:complete len:1331 (+),score=18.53 TRINITY_DN7354_c0_g1_i6:604-4596(+)
MPHAVLRSLAATEDMVGAQPGSISSVCPLPCLNRFVRWRSGNTQARSSRWGYNRASTTTDLYVSSLSTNSVTKPPLSTSTWTRTGSCVLYSLAVLTGSDSLPRSRRICKEKKCNRHFSFATLTGRGDTLTNWSWMSGEMSSASRGRARARTDKRTHSMHFYTDWTADEGTESMPSSPSASAFVVFYRPTTFGLTHRLHKVVASFLTGALFFFWPNYGFPREMFVGKSEETFETGKKEQSRNCDRRGRFATSLFAGDCRDFFREKTLAPNVDVSMRLSVSDLLPWNVLHITLSPDIWAVSALACATTSTMLRSVATMMTCLPKHLNSTCPQKSTLESCFEKSPGDFAEQKHEKECQISLRPANSGACFSFPIIMKNQLEKVLGYRRQNSVLPPFMKLCRVCFTHVLPVVRPPSTGTWHTLHRLIKRMENPVLADCDRFGDLSLFQRRFSSRFSTKGTVTSIDPFRWVSAQAGDEKKQLHNNWSWAGSSKRKGWDMSLDFSTWRTCFLHSHIRRSTMRCLSIAVTTRQHAHCYKNTCDSVHYVCPLLTNMVRFICRQVVASGKEEDTARKSSCCLSTHMSIFFSDYATSEYQVRRSGPMMWLIMKGMMSRFLYMLTIFPRSCCVLTLRSSRIASLKWINSWGVPWPHWEHFRTETKPRMFLALSVLARVGRLGAYSRLGVPAATTTAAGYFERRDIWAPGTTCILVRWTNSVSVWMLRDLHGNAWAVFGILLRLELHSWCSDVWFTAPHFQALSLSVCQRDSQTASIGNCSDTDVFCYGERHVTKKAHTQCLSETSRCGVFYAWLPRRLKCEFNVLVSIKSSCENVNVTAHFWLCCSGFSRTRNFRSTKMMGSGSLTMLPRGSHSSCETLNTCQMFSKMSVSILVPFLTATLLPVFWTSTRTFYVPASCQSGFHRPDTDMSGMMLIAKLTQRTSRLYVVMILLTLSSTAAQRLSVLQDSWCIIKYVHMAWFLSQDNLLSATSAHYAALFFQVASMPNDIPLTLCSKAGVRLEEATLFSTLFRATLFVLFVSRNLKRFSTITLTPLHILRNKVGTLVRIQLVYLGNYGGVEQYSPPPRLVDSTGDRSWHTDVVTIYAVAGGGRLVCMHTFHCILCTSWTVFEAMQKWLTIAGNEVKEEADAKKARANRTDPSSLSGQNDSNQNLLKILLLVIRLGLTNADAVRTAEACLFRTWLIPKASPYGIALKTAGRLYYDKTKGKKTHSEGPPDCWYWGAVIQVSIEHCTDSKCKDVLSKHANEVKTPADLVGRVLCCRKNETFDKNMLKLRLHVTDMDDVQNIVIRMLDSADGVVRKQGRAPPGSLERDLQKVLDDAK